MKLEMRIAKHGFKKIIDDIDSYNIHICINLGNDRAMLTTCGPPNLRKKVELIVYCRHL